MSITNDKIGDYMKKLTCLLLLLLLPVLVFAQQSYTLEQCRQQALQNNHKIKIADDNIQASQHNVKSARTAFLPKLSFVGNYTRVNNKIKYETEEMSLPISNRDGSFDQEHMEVVTGPDGNPLTNPDGTPVVMPKDWLHIPSQTLKFGEHNNYMLNFGLVQPIFTGGKILQQYKISKSTAKIAEAQKSLTNADVILKTDELFWKILSIKEKVTLAEDYIEMINGHIEDLENYLEEGLITNNELLKAKVKGNEAKMNRLKAKNGVRLAKMALCQHMGLTLDSDIELTPTYAKTYHSIDAKLNNEKVKNRKELAILEQSIDINKSMEKIAFSKYLPNIVLTSNYTSLNPNPYNSFEAEFGSDINVGISCEIEIFNWNDRGHKLASARHMRKAAERQYEESKEMIQLEIQQAAFQVNESIKKIKLAKSTLEQARENLAVTKDNFKEGIAKSSDVLDAQTLWQKAKSELIESKSEYRINYAVYNKTIGKYNL